MNKLISLSKKIFLFAALVMCTYIISGTIYFHITHKESVVKTDSKNLNRCLLTGTSAGISKIKATNDDDLFYCIGYLQGHDRSWQIDYLRKLGQGRSSEVMGAKSLPADVVFRWLKLTKQSKEIFKNLSADSKRNLENYADGINVAFQSDTHYMFKELNYDPEKWTPEDSILLILIQSFGQSKHNLDRWMYQKGLADKFTPQLASQLFDESTAPWFTTIIKQNEVSKLAAKNNDTKEKTLKLNLDWWTSIELPFLGSNNWVTTSKKNGEITTWLASDPHLNISHPPFWYWQQIETSKSKVVMGGLPGAPIFAAGFNGKVAWSPTNSFMKDMELVWTDEKASLSEIRYETIWFKWLIFKIPLITPLQNLLSGEPVIPKFLIESKVNKKLILYWTGFQISASDIENFFNVQKAQNTFEIDNTLKNIKIPSWNIVFADLNGDIGFRTIGRGILQNPDDFDQTNFIRKDLKTIKLASPDQMPHLFHPERNYIVTANNQQFPENSTDTFGKYYASSFRAFRIEELIKESSQLNYQRQLEIQCDDQMVDARFISPYLIESISKINHPDLKFIINLLTEWKIQNYSGSIECRACAVYEKILDSIISQTKLDRTGIYHALKLGSLVLNEKIISKAIEETAIILKSVHNWGYWHRIQINTLAVNDKFLFPEGLPMPGNENSVAPATNKWNGDFFTQTSGANHRFLVKLGKNPVVYLQISGNNKDLPPEETLRNKEAFNFIKCRVSRFPY